MCTLRWLINIIIVRVLYNNTPRSHYKLFETVLETASNYNMAALIVFRLKYCLHDFNVFNAENLSLSYKQ